MGNNDVKSVLRILIGDDSLDGLMDIDRINGLLDNISKATGQERSDVKTWIGDENIDWNDKRRFPSDQAALREYISQLHRRLKDNAIYKCSRFPVPGISYAEFKLVTCVEDMIREATSARPHYDWIVSDLDYGIDAKGRYRPKGGFEVMAGLKGIDGITVIFTSEGSLCSKEVSECNADYRIVAQKNQDKWVLLAETIVRHYMKQG